MTNFEGAAKGGVCVAMEQKTGISDPFMLGIEIWWSIPPKRLTDSTNNFFEEAFF